MVAFDAEVDVTGGEVTTVGDTSFIVENGEVSILDNKDEQDKTVIHTATQVVTGNFLKFPVGEKRGKYVKFMGSYWIFPGISQFGKMQQYPFMGQKKPKIFPVMGFS